MNDPNSPGLHHGHSIFLFVQTSGVLDYFETEDKRFFDLYN